MHTGPRILEKCVFYGNTTAGIKSADENEMIGIGLRDNIFVGNGVAVDVPAGGGDVISYGTTNWFFNNTTNRVNFAAAEGDDTSSLTVNPFVDAAGGDFRLNNTAGGGAALRAVTRNSNWFLTYPFGSLVEPAAGSVIVIED